MSYLALSVPRTGLEPARLSALAPETSASTIPPPGHCVASGRSGQLGFAVAKLGIFFVVCKFFRIFLMCGIIFFVVYGLLSWMVVCCVSGGMARCEWVRVAQWMYGGRGCELLVG